MEKIKIGEVEPGTIVNFPFYLRPEPPEYGQKIVEAHAIVVYHWREGPEDSFSRILIAPAPGTNAPENTSADPWLFNPEAQTLTEAPLDRNNDYRPLSPPADSVLVFRVSPEQQVTRLPADE